MAGQTPKPTAKQLSDAAAVLADPKSTPAQKRAAGRTLGRG